jgi:diaminopimelate epimerase
MYYSLCPTCGILPPQVHMERDCGRTPERSLNMEIPFVKLHGNGNDFILVDEAGSVIIPDEMKGEFARLYCDRRFGIGGDGVLYLVNTEGADIGMRLFQPDASEAAMCGNGIRCLAKYAFDKEYVTDICTIQTLAGIMEVSMGYDEGGLFTAAIDMGEILFDCAGIPATCEGEYKQEIEGYTVYAVNTGVPHAVVFVDDLESVSIMEIAPKIRFDASFPEGANVNFVRIMDEGALSIRTYERGVEEETWSCGTGATASAAVAHHLGKTGNEVTVATKGGLLTIHLDDHATMEGPAETVFEGQIAY